MFANKFGPGSVLKNSRVVLTAPQLSITHSKTVVNNNEYHKHPAILNHSLPSDVNVSVKVIVWTEAMYLLYVV